MPPWSAPEKNGTKGINLDRKCKSSFACPESVPRTSVSDKGMPTQLNTEDEKEFKPELSDALNDMITNLDALDDSKLSTRENNLKVNLKNLNIYLQQITTKEEVSNNDTKLDIDHISANDSLGHEVNGQVDMLAGVDDSSPPPRKRQCRVKMEIYVPTMDLLLHERHLKAEGDYKKLDKMRNPNVKKNEDMMLHPETLRARLQALGPSAFDLYPITLDKGSQDLMVSRDFMATKYGGSMQATFPAIGKKLMEKHGIDDFMYLHPTYQPVAPEVPGANGLFLTTSTSVGYKWPVPSQRVFTRIDSNVWQYMGMYRLTPSPSLTKREWAEQHPKVRRTWGREICRQNWGGRIRARIFARKTLGREPTKKEVEDLSEEGSRVYSVTSEEVMAAFTKGEEILGIWLMECVGYDNAFQLELCEKFPLWVPAPKRRRGSGKSSTKKSKAAGSAVRADRKRKREESPDSDIDLNEDESELEAAARKEP